MTRAPDQPPATSGKALTGKATMPEKLTEAQEVMLARHIAALEDDARAMDAVALLFRPEFDACWEIKADGSMGQIIDSERALQLREVCLDRVRDANYNRDLAAAIRHLMGAAHPNGRLALANQDGGRVDG